MIFSMLVVSNTSPIANLAAIGRLGLLREQFHSLLCPAEVWRELLAHPDSTARAEIEQARRDGWLVVSEEASSQEEWSGRLDPGEAKALALAVHKKADLILLDESAARRVARELSLAHTGVLGILLCARRSGRISSLAEEIRRLREASGFFVGSVLEHELLRAAGEV